MNLLGEFFARLWGRRVENMLRERRSSPRKPCDIQGVFTYQEGSQVPLVIKDIGLYGMHVWTYKKLPAGNCILVAARGDGKVFEKSRYVVDDIYMTVLWCRKAGEEFTAGLRFNDSPQKIANSWLALLFNRFGLTPEATNYKRRSLRVTAKIPLSWRILGSDREHRGMVLDMSLDGVLISVEKKMPTGESIWIKIGPHKSLRPLVCHAAIVRTHRTTTAIEWLAGARFDGLDEDQTKLLRSYVGDLYLAE
jgi:hypothetical protein